MSSFGRSHRPARGNHSASSETGTGRPCPSRSRSARPCSVPRRRSPGCWVCRPGSAGAEVGSQQETRGEPRHLEAKGAAHLAARPVVVRGVGQEAAVDVESDTRLPPHVDLPSLLYGGSASVRAICQIPTGLISFQSRGWPGPPWTLDSETEIRRSSIGRISRRWIGHVVRGVVPIVAVAGEHADQVDPVRADAVRDSPPGCRRSPIGGSRSRLGRPQSRYMLPNPTRAYRLWNSRYPSSTRRTSRHRTRCRASARPGRPDTVASFR